jgi:hypothetical protein
VSTLYLWLKWAHIVSSTVLFGTGAGIAFFFIRAHRTKDVRIIAAVSRDVVWADAVFTATAVVLQPVTGIALALLGGYPLTTPWIEMSLALYSADRLLLAAGRLASDSDGRSGAGCGHQRRASAAGVLPLLSMVDRAGLACLHWRSDRLLFDGCEAGVVKEG